MARIKKDPASEPDARRTTDLDLVRTAVWYSHLCEAGKFSTAYAAAKHIEGHADNKRKWQRYSKMEGVPNQDTLDMAEAKFPGSAEVFLSGPEGTKLWVALNTSEPAELKDIAYASEQIDGQIAQLKLDLEQGIIKVTHQGISNYDNDEFVRASLDIYANLRMSSMPEQYAVMIQYDFILPLADHLYAKEDRDLYDFILVGDYPRDEKKERYKEMQLPSVGGKGSGGWRLKK